MSPTGSPAVARRLPILAYHDVGGGSSPLSVSPGRFRQHMSSLHEAGWRCLSLDDLIIGRTRGAWPTRSVVLTFDDGLASFAEHALPVLVRFGFPAVLFAVSGCLGRPADWPGWPADLPRRLLDAGALAEAASAGIEIGAHSVSHRPFTQLSLDDVTREILDSRAQLEDLLGRRVRSFAYPYGDAPPSSIRVVREHFDAGFGIRLAFVTPRSCPEIYERIDAYYLRHWPRLTWLDSGVPSAWLRLRATARRARLIAHGGYGPR
jgi:peptidoglycan/xylan/chitin deacetylase (PgdA/CDA1 family)